MSAVSTVGVDPGVCRNDGHLPKRKLPGNAGPMATCRSLPTHTCRQSEMPRRRIRSSQQLPSVISPRSAMQRHPGERRDPERPSARPLPDELRTCFSNLRTTRP